MRWTYNDNQAAHYTYADGRTYVCTVPDQVAADQRAWDGRQITVLVRGDRRKGRLDGAAYDLWGSGTGDMVVRPA